LQAFSFLGCFARRKKRLAPEVREDEVINKCLLGIFRLGPAFFGRESFLGVAGQHKIRVLPHSNPIKSFSAIEPARQDRALTRKSTLFDDYLKHASSNSCPTFRMALKKP